MDKVQATFTSTASPSNLSKPSILDEQQSRVALPSSTNSFGHTISAEAQYLFEMDKYLFGLDRTERDKALDYLSNSDDVLQKKAAEYFIKIQESLGEDRKIVLDTTGSEQARKLLDTGLEINGSTEIAVMPLATKVFRLDGNENFHPIRLNHRNDALIHQLDALEKATPDVLGNQDAANLYGSVRDALSASENILLAFDDVLHFNYEVEKARTAIDFIDAPKSIESALTDILAQGIAYQNDKQSRFLEDTKQFLNDSRVSQIASENVRLGTAAQQYNIQLQKSLYGTGLSVLDARSTVTQLLTQHTDLIRFSPDKLDQAFTFYKNDSESFEKALNKEFGVAVDSVELEINSTLLDVGRDYAEGVIEDIENHFGT